MLIYPIDRPIKASGHIHILYGNLAPEGCVGKITGKEGLEFEGPARVFDSEELMLRAVEAGPQKLKVMHFQTAGHFWVLRFNLVAKSASIGLHKAWYHVLLQCQLKSEFGMLSRILLFIQTGWLGKHMEHERRGHDFVTCSPCLVHYVEHYVG